VIEIEEKALEKSWLCTANCCSVWVHRTVSGVPDWLPANWPLSGKLRRCTTKIHRTVRWCTGLSGGAPDCPVSQRPPAQRSAAKSAGDAWPAPTIGWEHRTVRCAPDSVRCANQREVATVDCARNGRKSRTGHEQWLSGGAPDCPMRHPTEGNFGLPKMPPTAPGCLGAIKGTPRHMEESPKHTLSILSLPHFVSAHLIDFVSDLSSILVVNLLRFI
jgi:hypothetical protein